MFLTQSLVSFADPRSLLAMSALISLILAGLLVFQAKLLTDYQRSFRLLGSGLFLAFAALLGRSVYWGEYELMLTLTSFIPGSFAYGLATMACVSLYGCRPSWHAQGVAGAFIVIGHLVFHSGPASVVFALLVQAAVTGMGVVAVLQVHDPIASGWKRLLMVTGLVSTLPAAVGALSVLAASLQTNLISPQLGELVRVVLLMSWVLAPAMTYALFNLIVNARVAAQLHTLATVDSLTGTKTRREYFDASRKSITNANDNDGSHVAVLMIDIDHFKNINDRFGHACGDEVLQLVARRMRDNLRHDAVLGRYGGEEFGVTLSVNSLDEVRHVAQRLRMRVADVPFQVGNERLHVTVSIGAALYDGQSAIEELVNWADECLYSAKRAGRNQVVMHENSGPVSLPELVSNAS